MPIHRYNELLSKEIIYDDKSDVIYIENYWHDEAKIVYYKNDKALEAIQKRAMDVLDEYEQIQANKNKPPISKEGISWLKAMFNIK